MKPERADELGCGEAGEAASSVAAGARCCCPIYARRGAICVSLASRPRRPMPWCSPATDSRAADVRASDGKIDVRPLRGATAAPFLDKQMHAPSAKRAFGQKAEAFVLFVYGLQSTAGACIWLT